MSARELLRLTVTDLFREYKKSFIRQVLCRESSRFDILIARRQRGACIRRLIGKKYNVPVWEELCS